jgi:hypothetical protein
MPTKEESVKKYLTFARAASVAAQLESSRLVDRRDGAGKTELQEKMRWHTICVWTKFALESNRRGARVTNGDLMV